jgi:hypothetical protein
LSLITLNLTSCTILYQTIDMNSAYCTTLNWVTDVRLIKTVLAWQLPSHVLYIFYWHVEKRTKSKMPKRSHVLYIFFWHIEKRTKSKMPIRSHVLYIFYWHLEKRTKSKMPKRRNHHSRHKFLPKVGNLLRELCFWSWQERGLIDTPTWKNTLWWAKEGFLRISNTAPA